MSQILPTITVVTPSYNQAAYLEATINSVLGQNYPNLEYIIIDGGSTDGSVEIIKKYASQLAYWVSEPDAGLYAAVQKGFDRSTGEVMAWLNSDDLYHTQCFFVVADIFSQNSDIQWLTGIQTYFDEAGRLVHTSQHAENWSLSRFLLRGGQARLIQQESTFWRRDLWEKTGAKLDTQFSLAADYALWRRYFNHASLYTVHTALAGFRMRSKNQKSLEQRAGYLEEMAIVRENHPLNKSQTWRYHICVWYDRSVLRFIKNSGLIRQITRQLFKFPPILVYNRFTNYFEKNSNI